MSTHYPYVKATWLNNTNFFFLHNPPGQDDTDATTKATSPQSPLTSELNSEPCPATTPCNCTTLAIIASAITAASTVLLATVIFVLVQIALCRRLLTRIGSKNETTTPPQPHNEQVYEQVLGCHYDVPKGQVQSSHYDMPKGGTNETADHTYMAVEGRVLITATNKMAKDGSYDPTYMARMCVASGGEGITNGGDDEDHTYSDVDNIRRAVSLKHNEAYAAVYRNQPL